MKRRQFLAATAAFCTPLAWSADEGNHSRLLRPEASSDEGGLWALMDRAEVKLRQSPFLLHDAAFQEYVQQIACRLGGAHCPDIRVHLVRNRQFNAMMAPNGMMQVWSGLMLRVENEAQLAAVLGHEIGHYIERHSVARLREAKSRTSYASLLAQPSNSDAKATASALSAFTREHENQADKIGLQLMSKAGYDPREAALIWQNMLQEAKADPSTAPSKASLIFATHPPPEERYANLSTLATEMPKGTTGEMEWLARTAPFRREWLNDEVKRNTPLQSLVLMARLMKKHPKEADFAFTRAEVYRLRSKDDDLDKAILDYQLAISLGKEPPETHRGLGAIYRDRKQFASAKTCFQRYIALVPEASDSLMIQSYIEEMNA